MNDAMNSIYSDIHSQPPHIGNAQKALLRSSSRFQDELGVQLAQNGAAASSGADLDQQKQSLVHLGSLSPAQPTVSHLIVDHPEYKQDCWSIVHDPINSNKHFRELPASQDVWLNPATREIIFEPDQQHNGSRTAKMDAPEATVATQSQETASPTVYTSKTQEEVTDQDHHVQAAPSSFLAPAFSFTSPTLEDREQSALTSSQALSQAVAAYQGQPYSDLDCYELVVQGLKDLGIQYSGQQGLQNALIQEAKANNLPLNALLTGEGLISSLGSPIAESQISPHKDEILSQAEGLLASWQDRLEPGMIISFSTQSRGHTGVLSRHGNRWTFINSGRIDNSVHPGEDGQQVGEEDLLQELANWMHRAADEDSQVQITVGRLEQEKVASYQSAAKRRA